jgi:hypothetical protein
MLTMSEVDGKRTYDLGKGVKGEDIDLSLLSEGYLDLVKIRAPVALEKAGYTFVHIIYRDDIANVIPSSPGNVPYVEAFLVKREAWTPRVIIVDGSYSDKRTSQTSLIDSGDDIFFIERAIASACKAAHEINRIYCEACGDDSVKPWDECDTSQRVSIQMGVEDIIRNSSITPVQQHEGWLKLKEEEGWVYGEVKDVEKKIHPCMLPYDQLPAQQRTKDTIFGTVVRAILAHHGVLPVECV